MKLLVIQKSSRVVWLIKERKHFDYSYSQETPDETDKYFLPEKLMEVQGGILDGCVELLLKKT